MVGERFEHKLEVWERRSLVSHYTLTTAYHHVCIYYYTHIDTIQIQSTKCSAKEFHISLLIELSRNFDENTL